MENKTILKEFLTTLPVEERIPFLLEQLRTIGILDVDVERLYFTINGVQKSLCTIQTWARTKGLPAWQIKDGAKRGTWIFSRRALMQWLQIERMTSKTLAPNAKKYVVTSKTRRRGRPRIASLMRAINTVQKDDSSGGK